MIVWPSHERLYRAEQVRELDRLTIAAGTTGFDLMQQAGRTAFRHLTRQWPECRSVTVLCGGGNNGGDGYVIAALARRHGLRVQLLALTDPLTLKEEAAEAYQWAIQHSVNVELWQPDAVITGQVVVDALLGIGLTGRVKAPFDRAIAQINSCSKPVFSIDIPSGLCADRGVALGCAVQADLTVTFIGKKIGLWTGQGPALAGIRRFEPLLVPESVRSQVSETAEMISPEDIARLIKPRRRTAHKGDCGRILLVGGDIGLAGAMMLSSQTAARSGAGLVKVMTRPEHVSALIARQPEMMVTGLTSVHQIDQWLAWCDVVVVGPGLGQEGWGQQLWQKVMLAGCAKVIDADALNLMASKPSFMERLPTSAKNWVLTPHPGEAARLLGTSIEDVEQDRPNAVRLIQQKFGGTVLLKGAGTLIYDGQLLSVNSSGNPGMASGGMGDVLAGLVGALRAQGLSGYDAACLGTQVHGLAADQLAKKFGERGLLAADLIRPIRVLLNPECAKNDI
ncbi:bifunctional ADP-dependent NAD(P)H-hydrate dehydratase/NAD(P)H-hydrate epimerase [Oceanospirillum maris]|uniref:bifunctional ADP-dependent NAD(P)H-hydrate dehydratase/NAD(P)H-hydrate epimerase n=1 Tax=Oceanospirillum maris TaxID=64977 RepID=UPI000411499D|nr:bifunctional ADP-dependent NAD(P)H-hydrate dehydratase/NAD(P)H-hydrate epimerase [Oceanospirillum maris]